MERIEEVSKTTDEQAKAMIPDVREAYAAYQKSMQNTLRLVDGVKDVSMNESTQQLRDATLDSRAAAEELQGKVRAVAIA